MSNYIYWPYDEVSLDIQSSGNVTLKTPWLEATTSTQAFNETKLSQLCSKIDDKSLAAHDLGLVNDFFRFFHQYPVAYILPTEKNAPNLDTHTLLDRTLLGENFSETFERIFSSEEWNEQELLELKKVLPRMHWEWDSEAALSFASIDGLVHPESLFSAVRRFHILELMSTDSGQEIMSLLDNVSPEHFREAVCRLVRQNHYVTEQCYGALKPSLALAQHAAPLIEKFMNEERGHDKILAKALSHVGVSAESVPVTVQTKALMYMLKYCATRNFLAFSMAIDAFERSNYQEIDPLAQLLLKGGFDKAAEFVNLHMKINDDGKHENIAAQFLLCMNLCDRDYALEALRLMEILSMLMCKISQSAV